MIVTEHAITRYIERIAPVDRGEARAVIVAAAPAVDRAAAFGAPFVRLGNGARLVLRGDCVVTVFARRMFSSRRHDGAGR